MNELVTQLIEIQINQMELTALVANQQRFQYLSVKELPIFNGHPYEYFPFVSAFNSIISDNLISDKDCLYYLAKYTSEKANDIVKRFLAVNSTSTIKITILFWNQAHYGQLKQGFPLRFNDLLRFVKEESDLANDPVFSLDVLK